MKSRSKQKLKKKKQKPCVSSSDLILPKEILAEFIEQARENVNEDGKLGGLLCYFLGHEKKQNQIVDGIIFPNQISTASNVDDIGINGSNTFQWVQENHPDKTLFACTRHDKRRLVNKTKISTYLQH